MTSDRKKSNSYEIVQCSECPNKIKRKTGVLHPVCSDCKRRKMRETWKTNREAKTYAHSKNQTTG